MRILRKCKQKKTSQLFKIFINLLERLKRIIIINFGDKDKIYIIKSIIGTRQEVGVKLKRCQ